MMEKDDEFDIYDPKSFDKNAVQEYVTSPLTQT